MICIYHKDLTTTKLLKMRRKEVWDSRENFPKQREFNSLLQKSISDYSEKVSSVVDKNHSKEV